MTGRGIRAGWSRTRLRPPPGLVLDVGSGAYPNPAADVLCDGDVDDSQHRHGLALVIDRARPFVVARVEALPFRDGAFALVIASHLAEHVDDPAAFCSELGRVGRTGYIETPSPLADVLLHEDYHRWRVSSRGGTLRFRAKGERSARSLRWTEPVYRAFYAGRPSCSRRTYPLPRGPAGRVAAFVLRALGAVLNRSGVMHTRYRFGPDRPLRSEVVEAEPGRPRVTFVERQPPSGFMRHDREALEQAFDTTTIPYGGRPTLAYVRACLRAPRRSDALYTFFASEHALLPALAFAAWRKPFVLAPAGYDYAAVPAHGYGLAAQGKGWLPRLLARLATRIICCSAAAHAELVRLAPGADGKATVSLLGVDGTEWTPTDEPRRPDLVVTLAYVDETSWSRKGIDRFVAAAAADPDRRYVLAGRVAEEVAHRLEGAPANLEVAGFLDHEGLRRLFWSATAYVQLSWHESFGMAMAEAMACGCVPVTSDDPALLEVAGRWAEVSTDPAGDLDAIARACAAPVDRAALRADVLDRLPAGRRAEAVAATVAEALGVSRAR